ncbi:MAG: hypothetical protein LAN63_14590 [Acidobacteriia bacterium]|nr:hypothetical protein [Terriglobia bacterium]
MTLKQALLLSLAVICVSPCAHAQAWSGILAPSRATDWSNVGVAGGIPSANWPICTTLNPPQTAAQISTALTNCASAQPTGGVVLLGPGTFNLSAGINAWHSGLNNTVLRGSGSNSTFLVFTGGVGCILTSANVCIQGSSNQIGNSSATATDWTSGYSVGSTQLTVASTAGFQTGDMVAVDQINDNADTGNILTCSTDASDNVGFICSQQGGPAGGRNCPGSGGVGNTNLTCRAQHQWAKVTNIAGNVLTIDTPIYHPNWRSSQSPQVWTPGVIGSVVGLHDGIENLSIDSTGDPTDRAASIQIGNCYECWVLGVKAVRTIRRAEIWLVNAPRTEIRNNYLYGSNGTSQAYGVEVDYGTKELVINNVIQHTTGALTIGGDTGSVYAYNYLIFDFLASPPTWMIQDVSGHDAGTNLDLFEGNVSNSFGADAIHGTQFMQTEFRNYFLGWEVGKTQQTIPFFADAYNRYFNSVGNVLGQPGVHTQYQDLGSSGSNANGSVFVLGWSNSGSDCCSMVSDPVVHNSMMRWGNWDVVTNAVRYCTANGVPLAACTEDERAVGASVYPGLTNPRQSLPASFFLSSEPAWWPPAKPWPPIGPDVTSGNLGQCTGGTMAGSACTATSQCTGGGTCSVPALSGHLNSIPAQDCFLSVMGGPADGSGNALNFDATSCYGDPPPPPEPPTGLSAVIH